VSYDPDTMKRTPTAPEAAKKARAGGTAMAELQKNAARVAALLKAMANPARLVVLCQLSEGERSVGELERAVGLSQSGISQHLAVLRRGHVVASRRDGQTVFYSLASSEVVTLMGTLHAVFCNEPTVRPPARLKARAA
jgi:DNA-binding transcriptional ArsR family regulator